MGIGWSEDEGACKVGKALTNWKYSLDGVGVEVDLVNRLDLQFGVHNPNTDHHVFVFNLATV